jgi:hypothetical protein
VNWRVLDETGREVPDPELKWRHLSKLEQAAIAKAIKPYGWRLERYTPVPTVRLGTNSDWGRFQNGLGPEPGSDEWREHAKYCSWLRKMGWSTERIEAHKSAITEEELQTWRMLTERGML